MTGIEWVEKNFKIDAAFKALFNKKIDALFLVIGMPIPIFQEFTGSMKNEMKLINVKHKKLVELYDLTSIPANTYPWQSKKVITYSVPSILITNNHTPSSKIELLTKCIIDNLDFLRKQKHRKWREVNPQLYKNVKWPIHPAAKKIIDQ